MRALSIQRASALPWRRPLAACPAQAARRQPAPAAARVYASSAASSNGSLGGSRGASSANGWLLHSSPYLTSASGNDASSNSSSSGEPYDAIMMLGGGLLPDGGLPEWVVRRLDGCLHLYQQQIKAAAELADDASSSSSGGSGGLSSSGGSKRWGSGQPGACPIVLLGAGTPHKPPVINGNGYVLHESTAYASYLMQRGVPALDLLKETQSYDTVGNSYFSLLLHALPAGWRRIAVVTSEFHMPRTAATFDFVYSLAGRQLYGDHGWFALEYCPVSDEHIFAPEVLEARAIKEAEAVAAWQRNTAGMSSLADLHGWLYATHLCYSVSRQHEFGREQDLDPRLAATY